MAPQIQNALYGTFPAQCHSIAAESEYHYCTKRTTKENGDSNIPGCDHQREQQYPGH